jgi:hypothetical protein
MASRWWEDASVRVWKMEFVTREIPRPAKKSAGSRDDALRKAGLGRESRFLPAVGMTRFEGDDRVMRSCIPENGERGCGCGKLTEK